MIERRRNTRASIKAAIRQAMVEELRARGTPIRVIETHAGHGHMKRLAYHDADRWLGIDTDRTTEGTVHCDSRRVLRAMELAPYTVFDVDTHGVPWHWVWLVSQRRKLRSGESIGVAVTHGRAGGPAQMEANLFRAGYSQQMLDALGLHWGYSPTAFQNDQAVFLFRKLVEAWFGAKIGRVWEGLGGARGDGSTRYFSAVITA